MPDRPKRACRTPGCPELVVTGYCEAHAGQKAKRYDEWRGTAASRGYDSEWTRIRQQVLKRDNYLCIACLANGRVTPAKDVDHIVPLRVAPDLRLDLTNLQSLCRGCHNAKTASEQSS